MPELPEVETIVRELEKKIVGLRIKDAWIDRPKIVRQTGGVEVFKKAINNKKILSVKRRAKYIIINIEGKKTIFIHQKISGHLLYGKWKMVDGKPVADIEGPIKTDPYNRFIRFILYFNNGYMLGLSDVRRFGKVFLGETEKIEKEKKDKGEEEVKEPTAPAEAKPAPQQKK